LYTVYIVVYYNEILSEVVSLYPSTVECIMLSSVLFQQTPWVCESLQSLGFIHLSTIFTCIIYAPRLVQESFGPEKWNTFNFNFSCNKSQPFCCIRSQNIGHAEALMSMAVQTIMEN